MPLNNCYSSSNGPIHNPRQKTNRCVTKNSAIPAAVHRTAYSKQRKPVRQVVMFDRGTKLWCGQILFSKAQGEPIMMQPHSVIGTRISFNFMEVSLWIFLHLVNWLILALEWLVFFHLESGSHYINFVTCSSPGHQILMLILIRGKSRSTSLKRIIRDLFRNQGQVFFCSIAFYPVLRLIDVPEMKQ